MKYVIEIRAVNSAFFSGADDDPAADERERDMEVSRILEERVSKHRSGRGPTEGNPRKLSDVNGNTVGEVRWEA